MQNCYSKGGRMPREHAPDQNERLTTKHIQTLSFLQELVNENKQLKEQLAEMEQKCSQCDELHKIAEESKERIKHIQEQYLQRADEINAMLMQKHRDEMMRIIEEKLEAEKQWQFEKQELKAQLDELLQTKNVLTEQVDRYKEEEGKLQIVTLRMESLQGEVEHLKDENERLRQANANQLEEIHRQGHAGSQNEKLIQELREVNQKNKELKFKVSKYEKELEELEQGKDEEQHERVERLKNKLAKVQKEKDLYAERFEEKNAVIEQLQAKIEMLEKLLKQNEDVNAKLEKEVTKLLHEIDMLKKQVGTNNGNKSFHEFVALKREMAVVKSENENLRDKIRFKPKSLPSLVRQSDSDLGPRPPSATKRK